MTHVVGIDPGLIHTGVVSMTFYPEDKMVITLHQAFAGADVHEIVRWLRTLHPIPESHVFVERYVPRQRLNTDTRMTEVVQLFATHMPWAKWVRNTGVKQVVSQELMQLLRVWQFPTVTHHQDLRSAARIGLYGMMKSTELNKILADFVAAYLDGNPWKVV